jgi:hypothetical protein
LIPKVMYITLPGRSTRYDNDSWEDSQDKMGHSNKYHWEVLTQDPPLTQKILGEHLPLLTFTRSSPHLSFGRAVTKTTTRKTRVTFWLQQLHSINYYSSGWSSLLNATIASSSSVSGN